MVSILLVIFVSLIIHVNCIIVNRCDDNRKDVVILLDSSSSVKARNFRKATNFVVDVIDKFEISKEKVRIGLVRFSSKISRILWLNESFNKTEIKLVIKNLWYNGGGTFTGSALRFINKNILNAKNGDRDDAPDLVIVITDGDSSNPEQTKSEAKLLHDRKVEIVSIGVGKKVKETELLNIASDKAFAIRVDDFDELSNKNLHDRLFKATCEGLAQKTTEITILSTSSTAKSTLSTIMSTLNKSTLNKSTLNTETSTPSTQTSTPSTQTSTPSTQTSTPSTDKSIPNEEMYTSRADIPTFSTKKSIPSTVMSTPSADTSTSSTDTSIAKTDTSTANIDTSRTASALSTAMSMLSTTSLNQQTTIVTNFDNGVSDYSENEIFSIATTTEDTTSVESVSSTSVPELNMTTTNSTLQKKYDLKIKQLLTQVGVVVGPFVGAVILLSICALVILAVKKKSNNGNKYTDYNIPQFLN